MYLKTSYVAARACRALPTSTRTAATRAPLRQQQRAGNASLASFKIPTVNNEPNQHYAPGSAERASLSSAVASLRANPMEVPVVIGGKPITAGKLHKQVNPAKHSQTVATYSHSSSADVTAAVDSAVAFQPEWASLPFADRAAIFLKAADLVSTKYRYAIMAATMVGQGKNAWQAEIDAAAELCDFLRFNVKYAQDLYAQQPEHNSPGIWNRVEYRPLEGFTYAVTPFNFTAIAGNLPCAPALMGNVVVWKPSASAIASGYLVHKILLEAGLPPNVIQFVPGDAQAITSQLLSHRSFASLHFTGSTSVFRSLYSQISNGVANGTYTSYPRIVGETGGKNFHLLHPSADVPNAAINTVRGAFEYQGQKCSATSRCYVPSSLWPAFKDLLVSETKKLQIGDPANHENFIGPVIHQASYDKLSSTIDAANKDPDLELLVGGTHDASTGYFITPSIYLANSPSHPLFSRELFGPVLVCHVYDDAAPGAYADIMKTIDSTSEYALTGAVFAQDRYAIRQAEEGLRNSAGNFYVNCKSTGAVVGQQPFGGGRASGTNDKAGSANLLGRFVNMRAIKEEFVSLKGVKYPSNERGS